MKRIIAVVLSIIATGALAASLFQTVTLQDTTIGLGQSYTATVSTTGGDVHYSLISVTTAGAVTNTINTEISDAGMCYIENKNTNTEMVVNVGFSSETYTMRFRNNQAALIPLLTNQAALYFFAENTGTNADQACQVVVYAHEL
jgi:hypothetical protein